MILCNAQPAFFELSQKPRRNSLSASIRARHCRSCKSCGNLISYLGHPADQRLSTPQILCFAFYHIFCQKDIFFENLISWSCLVSQIPSIETFPFLVVFCPELILISDGSFPWIYFYFRRLSVRSLFLSPAASRPGRFLRPENPYSFTLPIIIPFAKCFCSRG